MSITIPPPETWTKGTWYTPTGTWTNGTFSTDYGEYRRYMLRGRFTDILKRVGRVLTGRDPVYYAVRAARETQIRARATGQIVYRKQGSVLKAILKTAVKYAAVAGIGYGLGNFGGMAHRAIAWSTATGRLGLAAAQTAGAWGVSYFATRAVAPLGWTPSVVFGWSIKIGWVASQKRWLAKKLARAYEKVKYNLELLKDEPGVFFRQWSDDYLHWREEQGIRGTLRWNPILSNRRKERLVAEWMRAWRRTRRGQ